MINRLHGGWTSAAAIIDFSVNINPLGMSKSAKAAILENIPSIARYPQADSRDLKRVLAGLHGIKSDEIAVGNGSIELIYLIPKALAARKVLIFTPAFSEYEFACRSQGIRPIFFGTKEKDSFRIRFDNLKDYLSRVDTVFLGNPNNPTGTILSIDELSYLAEQCNKCRINLVVDEAFIDFVEGRVRDYSMRKALSGKNYIAIRSLTKFFAMPGLRAGYAVANRGLIKRITDLQYPWNVNSFAQGLAQTVLKDRAYMNRTRAYVSNERSFLLNGLKKIAGLKLFPSVLNFILCKLDGSGIRSAKSLNELLIKRGIFIRDCGNFRGLDERFFRIAVKRRADNIRLIKAMEEIAS